MTAEKDNDDQRRLRVTISDELEAVMRKHDVGGAIFLASRDSASWRFVFPPWSGLQPEPLPDGGAQLRLRLSSKAPELASATVGMIANIRDMCTDAAEVFGRTFRRARRELEAQGAKVDHVRRYGIAPHLKHED